MLCPECGSDLSEENYCEWCCETYEQCEYCDDAKNLDGYCTDCDKCPKCGLLPNKCDCLIPFDLEEVKIEKEEEDDNNLEDLLGNY